LHTTRPRRAPAPQSRYEGIARYHGAIASIGRLPHRLAALDFSKGFSRIGWFLATDRMHHQAQGIRIETGSRSGLSSRDRVLDSAREPPLGAHMVTPRRGYTHHGIY